MMLQCRFLERNKENRRPEKTPRAKSTLPLATLPVPCFGVHWHEVVLKASGDQLMPALHVRHELFARILRMDLQVRPGITARTWKSILRLILLQVLVLATARIAPAGAAESRAAVDALKEVLDK